MQDDFIEFKTEALVRLKAIELKIDHANEDRDEIKRDLADYRQYMDRELAKLDNKCIYIEQNSPNVGTFKIITTIVIAVCISIVGIVLGFLR